MLTSVGPFLQNEKEQLEEHYSGELCSYIGYQQMNRSILLLSYMSACVYKLYNTYYTCYLSIHVEARYKDQTIEHIKKQRYFEFFTQTLREAESSTTFYSCFNR